MSEKFEAHLTEIKIGKIVEAEVIGSDDTNVIVNLNYKFEGYIDRGEFEEVPEKGSRIQVQIKRIDDRRGAVFASYRQARLNRDMNLIRKKIKEKQPLKCRVVKLADKGLEVKLEDSILKGFIPVRKAGTRLQPVKPGELIEAYPEKLNGKSGVVILNRFSRIKELKEAEIDEFLSKLNKGDRLTGKVKSVTDFGAFVTIGPIDALVPKSELSWKRLSSPHEAVKPGDTIDIEVLDVNREERKVLASHRMTIKTRWHEHAEKIRPGDVFRGRVKKKTDSGYFVWLDEYLDGFLPREEFDKYIRSVESLNEGDEISVRVDQVLPNRRRILLKHPTR